MFNYFRPPQLPQHSVGGWFFRECNVLISPTFPSQVYPQKFPKKLVANEKVLWLVGTLELVRPNVCRYKLLMFNYLQMIGQVPSAENKSTIKFPKFNYFRQPPLATILCWLPFLLLCPTLLV